MFPPDVKKRGFGPALGLGLMFTDFFVSCLINKITLFE